MFKFKKIASILASTVMISSTVALAAAASYPVPFVQSGTGNVAVVYGSSPAVGLTDVVEASNIKSNLVDTLLGQRTTTTSTTTTTVTGEAAELFTGGSRLYINDTLNNVRTTLTKTELPTVLADNTFSGNADSKYTQTIDLGASPILTFTKQPTTSDEPVFGYALSSLTSNYLYNATVNFNKETNFTHASSKTQDITLFGQKFTVSSSTDNTNLVLFKEAQTIFLEYGGTTSTEVTISGKKYTVELVSASATTATVKVTNDAGTTDQKEVSEGASRKIAGLTIAVSSADQNNQKYSASLLAGAEKFTLASGSAVTKGDSDTVIDGTKVTFSGYSSTPASLSKIVISTTASDTDHDALTQSQVFKDPVFGSFKLEFSSLNIGQNDTSKRENLIIDSASTDKVQLHMTNKDGLEKTIVWAKNTTNGRYLQAGDDGQNITVFEMESAAKNDYIVAGNEENGRLVKVYQILNQSQSGAATGSGDKVEFQDAFSSDIYTTTITGEGAGTVVIGGKTYTVTYYDARTGVSNVTLNYPDSASLTGSAVIYPTIQTSKGGKLAFYEPITINASNWDNTVPVAGTPGHNLTQLRFPNGNGYTDIAVTPNTLALGNITVNSVPLGGGGALTTTGFAIGKLRYNATISPTVNDTFIINLINPNNGAKITDPALILFEEKDDNSNYEAMVITLRESSAKLGVNDVIRTWLTTTSSGTGNFRESMASDSKKIQEADLFGTVTTIDQNSADQYKVTISYPDEQVYANVYIAEDSASFTTGGSEGTGEAGNVLLIKDNEVSTLGAGKNLIVVGGSCINTVAAELLGSTSPICAAAFTTATTVGAGQFLIQTFDRTGGTVATLVAGYNAIDTGNAATYLRTQPVDTTVGKKYVGTSSSSATLVTASGTA